MDPAQKDINISQGATPQQSSSFLIKGGGSVNVDQSVQGGKVLSSGPYTTEGLLQLTFDRNASDLHLTVGYPPIIRVDGKLVPVGVDVLDNETVKKLIYDTMTVEQRELLEVNKEVDYAHSFKNLARFRVNAYTERGNLSAAFRLIPSRIRTIEELNLPKRLHDFVKLEQGLIIVTGPTGHGKSTTLAAMIQEINETQARNIVTIEDPIEYIFPPAKSLISQRELHQDTHSWEVALRSVLREDPDVVMVGEMRDYETIAATITVAETGHLVFATLHTNSASQAIDRIIDVFPPHQQEQIRIQLANVIEGVISQRLVPTIGGGRRAAVELMITTPAIRNLIREQKTYQIDNVIATSYDLGMQTMERSLVSLVREGKITEETAKRYSLRPEELLRLLKE
jgi:twitching motility protein PilT